MSYGRFGWWMILACGALTGCGLASKTEGLQSEDGARVWTTCDSNAADGVVALGATGDLCTFAGGCARETDDYLQRDDALCWEGVLYMGHSELGASSSECPAPHLSEDRSCVTYVASGRNGSSTACIPGALDARETRRCVLRDDLGPPDDSIAPWSFETQDLCAELQSPDPSVPQPDVRMGDPCTGEELCAGRFWGAPGDGLAAWVWCRDGRVEIVNDLTR
ncbi:MAG: hypothetical protein U0234_17000 [Sandaracinus sp.]